MRDTRSFWRGRQGWLAWAGYLLFAAAALTQQRWPGDAPEYLMYAYALSARLSPDISTQDMAQARAALIADGAPKQAHNILRWSTSAWRALGDNDAHISGALVRSPEGHTYTYHFWLYPALAAALFPLAQWLDAGVGWPFMAVNLLLCGAAIWYALGRWQAPPQDRHLLAAMFLVSGTTYYIWWPHPEVFSAALLLLGLLLSLDGRALGGLLCIGLAATQNPPIVLLLGPLALWLVWGRAERIPFWRCAVFLLVAGVVAVTPVIFNVLALGVANPIVAAGAADPRLISFGRLVSLYLDPSIGMIVGAPGVLLGMGGTAVLAMLAAALGRLGRRELAAACALLAAGVAGSLLLAIPALATTNWNHGMSVYSRYAYWTSVPMLVGFVLASRQLPGGSYRTLVRAAAVTLQIAAVAYAGVWGKRVDEHDFRPPARILMSRFPAAYNPIPDIFVERSAERAPAFDDPGTERLVFRFPAPPAPAAKVLMHRSNPLLRNACWAARQRNGDAVPSEAGWIYFNGPTDCPLPDLPTGD